MERELIRQEWVELERPFTADTNRGDATGPDLVIMKGPGPCSVTAVHGVVHYRGGRSRPPEVNTASLAILANRHSRACVLVVARALEIEDANQSSDHPARELARTAALWGTGRSVIDVHGQVDRESDVVLSWGGDHFMDGQGHELASRLSAGFTAAGFLVDLGGRSTGFAAAGPTMTRAAAETGSAAVQMEVSRRCRTFVAGSDRGRVGAFVATFIELVSAENRREAPE